MGVASPGKIKSGAKPLSLAKFLGVGCDCASMEKINAKINAKRGRFLMWEKFMLKKVIGLIKGSATF
jgi:hypothetical protein